MLMKRITKIFPLLACSTMLFSCGEKPSEKKGYDGRVFDISVAHNKSLILTSTENANHTYNLTITGRGDAVSYDRAESAPWYALSKRVENIVIENGILNIGDYYFASIPLEYVFLPMSVACVGAHSFNSDTTIYTYGSTLTGLNNPVYYYRETKPETPGNYFYLDNGIPVIYQYTTLNFLFIGNSFTYKQGDESNPSVPKYFKSIAENLGQLVNIDWVVKGSHTLTKFANKNDEYGAVVEDKLTHKSYDYVILQEQSTTPINNYNTFLTAARTLNTRIKQTQGNKCNVVLYETWGSPVGIEGTTYQTTSEMELALRDAYDRVGQDIGAKVNYVGKAFAYAFETLNINIYSDDNRHQSDLGAYYSASVHVRSIFGVTVERCTYYYSDDSAEQNKCKTLLRATDTII